MKKLLVMLIDRRTERSASPLVEGLERTGCEVVVRADPASDLERAVAEVKPDVILIDVDSPDRDILEGMRRIGERAPRPIVIFAEQSDLESIRSAVRSGVAAYVVKGASPERVRPVIDVALARFQETQTLREELRLAKNQLEERKLVERAKGILMKKRSVPENEAYTLLRRTAMEKNAKLADIARRVIELEELL